MKKLAVLALSGGLDSTSLLIRLLNQDYEIFALSFDYGQKHKEELNAVKRNIDMLQKNFREKTILHKVLNISEIGSLFESSLTSDHLEIPTGHYQEENMKSTVVPNRNAIFSSIMYGYALSLSKIHDSKVEIFLGVHSGDHSIYPDCRSSFYDHLETAFQVGNWDTENVDFVLPFAEYNKTDILADLVDNCADLKLNDKFILSNTLTSYNAVKGVSSGTSASDVERVEAFLNLGMVDPIPYEKGWEWTKTHVKQVLKNR